ncbi:MAG: hypothetical protein IKQ41_11270 [Clostridia bacterium]|nr:hypothetical protein [Clostridia bacterium]
MKSGNRSNALLVELLIVVMFFMLSSTVLLQVFSTARSQSRRAELMTQALSSTQNLADRLYMAADLKAELEALGFEKNEDGWIKESPEYTVTVTGIENEGTPGEILRFQVQATEDGSPLVTLPVARFQEVRP